MSSFSLNFVRSFANFTHVTRLSWTESSVPGSGPSVASGSDSGLTPTPRSEATTARLSESRHNNNNHTLPRRGVGVNNNFSSKQ